MLLSLYLIFIFQLLPSPSLHFQLGFQLPVLHLHFELVFQQHLHLTLHTFQLWHKFLDVLWLKTTQEWNSNILVDQSLQETGQESSLVHNYSSDTPLPLLPFSSVQIQSPGKCWEKQNFRNFSGSLAVTWELFLQMYAHPILISCPMRLKLREPMPHQGKGNKQVAELQRCLDSYLGSGTSWTVSSTAIKDGQGLITIQRVAIGPINN